MAVEDENFLKNFSLNFLCFFSLTRAAKVYTVTDRKHQFFLHATVTRRSLDMPFLLQYRIQVFELKVKNGEET